MDCTRLCLHFSSKFLFAVLLTALYFLHEVQTSQLSRKRILGGICGSCSACPNWPHDPSFPCCSHPGLLVFEFAKCVPFSSVSPVFFLLPRRSLSQISQLNQVSHLWTSAIILTHGCTPFFFTAPSTLCTYKCICMIIGLQCPPPLNRLSAPWGITSELFTMAYLSSTTQRLARIACLIKPGWMTE